MPHHCSLRLLVGISDGRSHHKTHIVQLDIGTFEFAADIDRKEFHVAFAALIFEFISRSRSMAFANCPTTWPVS